MIQLYRLYTSILIMDLVIKNDITKLVKLIVRITLSNIHTYGKIHDINTNIYIRKHTCTGGH